MVVADDDQRLDARRVSVEPFPRRGVRRRFRFDTSDNSDDSQTIFVSKTRENNVRNLIVSGRFQRSIRRFGGFLERFHVRLHVDRRRRPCPLCI